MNLEQGANLRVGTAPASLPRINAMRAALMSAAIVLLIALGEINHLCEQLLDGDRVWSPTGLTSSLSPGRAAAGWRFFAEAQQGHERRLGPWLTAYGVLDILFTLLYAGFLMGLCRRLPAARRGDTSCPPRRNADELDEPFRGMTRGWPLAFIALGSGLDILENVAITLGGRWPDALRALAAPLPLLSIAKWIFLVLGVVWLVRALRSLRQVECSRAGTSRLVLQALYTHRYSALIAIPLIVLGLGRGPDLLEQLPDIERRWLDPGELSDAGSAAAITVVLVVVTFFIGRLRTHYVWSRVPRLETGANPGPDDRPPPLILIWFIGPGLVAVGVWHASWVGLAVALWPLLIFVGVPLAIGVVSLCLRRNCSERLDRPRRDPASCQRFRMTALVGDVLPALLFVVTGLGAVRAFTGVVALGDPPRFAVHMLLGGAGLAVLGWWPYTAVLKKLANLASELHTSSTLGRWQRLLMLLTPGLEPPPRESDQNRFTAELRNRWLSWVILAVSVAGFVLVGLFPVPIAESLGVIATFQLALGLLSVSIAATVIALQATGAPEIFWVGPWRMPYAPITTLMLGACAVAATVGGGTAVHGLRSYPDDGTDADLTYASRPSFTTNFDDWLAAGKNCERSIPGLPARLKVRPLLLYAAEGGGIRAAYWTAAGVDAVASAAPGGVTDPCGSAFLSSGASGGAVGLTVASVVDRGQALEAVKMLTGPDALSAASTGLIIRDTVYAAAGIPLPSYGDDLPGQWADRAALIEQQWEEEIPELAGPWISQHTGWDWGTTGPLVLNSTSATSGCRALVSQVQVEAASRLATCDSGRPAAGSIDLVRCTQQIRATTAAMLASRFPYVTPSGAIECGGDVQQVVDGGYAENTGVGTLVDLAPQWAPLVRAHNSCVLARFRGSMPSACADATPNGVGAMTIVVPVLLYFDNGTGSDLIAREIKSKPEILVPVLTALGAKESLYSANSQLQRADAMLATEQLWVDAAVLPADIADAIDAWRRHTIYVLYQATKPSVAAPLGWVLSQRSMDTMDQALNAQRAVNGLEYGTLPQLIALLSGSGRP